MFYWEKIVITCDGDVLPCLGLWEIKGFLANVKKDSLRKSWLKIESLSKSGACLCRMLNNSFTLNFDAQKYFWNENEQNLSNECWC
jgi:hypothetical protein